jgi:hypothetical protein
MSFIWCKFPLGTSPTPLFFTGRPVALRNVKVKTDSLYHLTGEDVVFKKGHLFFTLTGQKILIETEQALNMVGQKITKKLLILVNFPSLSPVVIWPF